MQNLTPYERPAIYLMSMSQGYTANCKFIQPYHCKPLQLVRHVEFYTHILICHSFVIVHNYVVNIVKCTM